MFYLFSTLLTVILLGVSTFGHSYAQNKFVLGAAEMSLTNRYQNSLVNDVFRDNILLTLAYMKGEVTSKDFSWDKVQAGSLYTFTLKPGETFSFHEDVLPAYEGKIVQTTNAHYNGQEGFRSSGYLMGDGVCHLASLFNLAAQRANLHTLAPTNHDFAMIPEIDKKYGVSIYVAPNNRVANAQQNLYVTNTFSKPVEFVVSYNMDKVTIEVLSEDSNLVGISSW